jgi:tRNA modification GTPase
MDPVVTLVRHADALARARESLELARDSFLRGTPVDVATVDIQAAVEHIGSITGEVTTEEVLDRIFRDFCIGK